MFHRTTGAIIQKDGKILLLRRTNTKVFNGYWGLPGGKVENNEDPEIAIIREIKEETNLDFKPVFFRKYHENFPHFEWESEAYIFYGKFFGKIRLSEESSDFGWFSIEEIKKLQLAFAHNKIVEDFTDGRTI